jgi:hypothetical protein
MVFTPINGQKVKPGLCDVVQMPRVIYNRAMSGVALDCKRLPDIQRLFVELLLSFENVPKIHVLV